MKKILIKFILQMNIKCKVSKNNTFPSKVIKTQRGDGMLGYHSYFDVQHN
jgi:hypothetical protein